MKILFIIIGRSKPSSRKRVLDSVDYLKGRGHGVDVVDAPGDLAGQLSILGRVARYDLVVLQKKLFSPVQLRLMVRANRNIIYDLDDAVMFHEVERKEPITGKFFRRFTLAASLCRGVIAGNNYLAEFAVAARGSDDGVAVLPTPVDINAVKPKQYVATGKLVVGWMGTKGNLRNLDSISGPLSEVFKAFPDACLKVVSDAEPDIPGIPVEFKPWSAVDEAEDLRSFDIGLMPLDDNIWTRGKGGYKLLQYMTAGVPSVASPVGINRDIISDGENGFLAADNKGWANALTTLAADPVLRENIGRAGRDTVEKGYSLERYNEGLAGFLERFV